MPIPLRYPVTKAAGTVVLALALCAAMAPAQALTLEFPGPATATASLQEPLTSYRLPIGPYSDAGLPTRLVEGAMDQTAWRIAAPDLTTLALIAPLRDQLAADGWTILFECETAACGGYDFRYGTDILPEPDMHVDLGDFRFLAAEKHGASGPEALSLMVSRSTTSGFVQLTRIGGVPAATPDIGPAAGATPPGPSAQPSATAPLASDPPASDIPAQPVPPGDIGARLENGGAFALEDLQFPSGTATLAPGDYASLADLAAYLHAKPDRAIAIVGHTDATGGLEANIVLSRKRAQSVRQRLIETYDLPGSQIIAEGVGFLAPRASNLTEDGRTQNRRVEVMLTSTQ